MAFYRDRHFFSFVDDGFFAGIVGRFLSFSF